VLYELNGKAPKRKDFETYEDYDEARMEFYDNLGKLALETETVKSQIQRLVESGIDESTARNTVASWYTQDAMESLWHKYDTPWEALDFVYDKYVYRPAQQEFFEEILPVKDTDQDLYYMLEADFSLRNERVNASDLIKYIMEEYPGKWTLKELSDMFDGIVMPSYDEKAAMEGYGKDAVENHIWAYYEMLGADDRKLVRETFGTLFQDNFLTGNTEDLSIELLGNWMNNLARMVGDDLTWKELPGVDEDIVNSSTKEGKDYGLPVVNPRDEEEYEEAKRLNSQYWNLRLAGDPMADVIAADPIYDKWFGAASPKSYFWYLYYEFVPPGAPGKEIRNNTIVKYILDKETSRVVASNSDYDRASSVIEAWLNEQGIEVEDFSILSDEFEGVRQLIKLYLEIPKENVEERKAFIEANPILKDYMFEEKPSEGGEGEEKEEKKPKKEKK